MASQQLGAYNGGSGSSSRRRVHARSGGRSTAAEAAKQLLSRLRSSLRRGSAARPRRRAAVRFGYDLQSYSQNFDDGQGDSVQLASSGIIFPVIEIS
ncbi:hypothetical protein BAE44_0021014 [Dichanthelium oligosanthes]|uniref:Uncharacterized protein n=1 Tax=Dichanthelium oligosanthes TaxID=888268 RepID=A0A1E5UYI8_9POAL|nr:hypothetical protein BAE44_0021014 [Dichanthelium oligosanthes]